MRLAFLVALVACRGESKPSAAPPENAGPKVQIVYSIDLDRAIDDRARVLRGDLEAGLADAKIAAAVRTPATPLGAVTIVPDDPAKQPAIVEILKSYADTIERRSCDAADGPLAVCIAITATHGEALKKAALTSAATTVRARLVSLGVTAPVVTEKAGQLVVVFPSADLDRLAKLRSVIARTGKLAFHVVDDGSAYMKQLYAHVESDPRARTDEIAADIDQWRDEGGSMHADYFLRAADREVVISAERARQLGCIATPVDAGQVRCRMRGRDVIESYLRDLAASDPRFLVPDDRMIGYESVEPAATAVDRRPYWRSYYLERAVRLTGATIANAQGIDDPYTDRPMVLLDFNKEGARVFGELTEQIVGKKLATILDDRIQSAPIITGPIRGGRASITMGGSDPRRQAIERDELVEVLKTGSLPAPLREESLVELR